MAGPARVPLYLASGSPRRRALLAEAQIAFELLPRPDADETPPTGLAPLDVVEFLASEKLRSVAHIAMYAPVLTADTLVFLDDHPLGKPADAAEAVRMLRSLAGRTHVVATGVAVGGPDGQGGVRVESGSAATTVRFRDLSDAEIELYVATGEPLDKAGAYAIQGGAAAFVDSVDGDRDTVIGLPIGVVRDLLARFAS